MDRRRHAGLSRREALAAIGGATVLAGALSDLSNARSREGNKMIYVLIHPAWLGGWCWNKVVPLLRTEGHGVHAPTLTGLGELKSTPLASFPQEALDLVERLREQADALSDCILASNSLSDPSIDQEIKAVCHTLGSLVAAMRPPSDVNAAGGAESPERPA